MPEQRDAAALLKAVASVIREHVSSAVTAIVERLEKVEKALNELPVPKNGEPGADGKSVTVEELQPLVAQLVNAGIAALPPAKNGEPGEPGTPGEPGKDGKSVTVDEIQPLVASLVKQSVAALPPAETGKPGTDGKSVTIEDVMPVIREAVAQLPKPKDGEDGKSVSVDELLPTVRGWFDALPKPKNGEPGTDGKSVTLDDVRELHEQMFAKWQLDWERRAMDVNQRCLDRFEKPKDGEDGKDGLGFDDFTPTFDGRRTFTMRWARGDQVKEFSFKIPALIECGVWTHGKQYEQGDCVTCGGNYSVALKDTTSRPGDDGDWRLVVRKGRDGKDAVIRGAAR